MIEKLSVRNAMQGRFGCSARFGVGEAEFRGPITPGTRCVRYEVDLRQVRRGRLGLGVADGRVLADSACVYAARDMRVAMVL